MQGTELRMLTQKWKVGLNDTSLHLALLEGLMESSGGFTTLFHLQTQSTSWYILLDGTRDTRLNGAKELLAVCPYSDFWTNCLKSKKVNTTTVLQLLTLFGVKLHLQRLWK